MERHSQEGERGGDAKKLCRFSDHSHRSSRRAARRHWHRVVPLRGDRLPGLHRAGPSAPLDKSSTTIQLSRYASPRALECQEWAFSRGIARTDAIQAQSALTQGGTALVLRTSKDKYRLAFLAGDDELVAEEDKRLSRHQQVKEDLLLLPQFNAGAPGLGPR